jgi:uncharacterized protein YnzC (UPF0291/DUF896 family)
MSKITDLSNEINELYNKHKETGISDTEKKQLKTLVKQLGAHLEDHRDMILENVPENVQILIKKVITAYTSGGHVNYGNMNRLFLHDKYSVILDTFNDTIPNIYLNAKFLSYIINISSFKEDLVVYRGFKGKSFEDIINKSRTYNDNIIEWRNFTSTSIWAPTAAGYRNKSGLHPDNILLDFPQIVKCCFFKINIPKNSPAFYIKGLGHDLEVILPPFSRFEIVNIDGHYIELKYLGPSRKMYNNTITENETLLLNDINNLENMNDTDLYIRYKKEIDDLIASNKHTILIDMTIPKTIKTLVNKIKKEYIEGLNKLKNNIPESNKITGYITDIESITIS